LLNETKKKKCLRILRKEDNARTQTALRVTQMSRSSQQITGHWRKPRKGEPYFVLFIRYY